MTPLFTICHTTARPQGWQESYRAWKAQAEDWEKVEYVLCMDQRWGFTSQHVRDARELGIVVVENLGRKCMVDGFACAALAATGGVLILNSDDQFPTPGWDRLLGEVIGDRNHNTTDFVVHVRTGWYDGPKSSSIQILSRGRYERLGYAMHPSYESLYADDDFLEAAYADGVVVDARALPVFPHLHGTQGETETDPVYSHQNRTEARTLGAAVLGSRRLENFGASLAGKVVLFCPVRQDPQTLALALKAHRALEGVAVRWYWDDNDNPISREMLSTEAQPPLRVRPRPTAQEVAAEEDAKAQGGTHLWDSVLMSRMAEIRDGAIEAFLATDASALLILDADVIPHPQTSAHLYSTECPIVSEVFWTRWNPTDPWLPNVWDFHNYGFKGEDSILRLRSPGVYPVGGLGALTLIRRGPLEAGVRFALVPSVLEWPGEDRHFAIRAAALGYQQWADTHYPPYHVYRPLPQLGEARAWYDDGADPGHFRDHWLTPEWADSIHALVGGPARPPTPLRRPSLSLCIPGERFCSAWVGSLLTLVNSLQNAGWEVDTQMGYSSNVYVTRECLWESIRSRPTPPDLILWLDDDNLLSWEHLRLLMDDLETHPHASGVAAWCWIQPDVFGIEARVSCGHQDDGGGKCIALPPDRLLLAMTQAQTHPDDALIEIDYTGFPAFLLRGSTLAAMPKGSFLPLIGPHHTYGMSGEDVAFCRRGRRLGLRWFVDPRVQIPHLKLRAAGPMMAAPPLAPLPSGDRGDPIPVEVKV